MADSNAHTDVDNDENDDDLDGLQPRLWYGDYTSDVMLCLFSGTAMLVICLPFLPQRYSDKSFDENVYLIRDIIFLVLAAICLVVIADLIRKKDKYHELGLALWPNRCKHCSRALTTFKRCEDITRSGRTLSSLRDGRHRKWERWFAS